MKAREVLEKYRITRNTLHKWVKAGKIPYKLTPTGQYDYFPDVVPSENSTTVSKKTVIYARVSTSSQKENLERQIERLKIFCSAKGYVLHEVHKEIGSALNYNRKKYIDLYNQVVDKQIDRIIIEYKDRLLRIGFEDFERLCKIFGTELIVADYSESTSLDKSKQQEITEDLMSIIHHFSMRIYSSRKRKKIVESLQNVLNLTDEIEENEEIMAVCHEVITDENADL